MTFLWLLVRHVLTLFAHCQRLSLMSIEINSKFDPRDTMMGKQWLSLYLVAILVRQTDGATSLFAAPPPPPPDINMFANCDNGCRRMLITRAGQHCYVKTGVLLTGGGRLPRVRACPAEASAKARLCRGKSAGNSSSVPSSTS